MAHRPLGFGVCFLFKYLSINFVANHAWKHADFAPWFEAKYVCISNRILLVIKINFVNVSKLLYFN